MHFGECAPFRAALSIGCRGGLIAAPIALQPRLASLNSGLRIALISALPPRGRGCLVIRNHMSRCFQELCSAPYWHRACIPLYGYTGGPMLRTQMQTSNKVLTVRLEGRFASDDAEQVRMLVTRCGIESKLVVDLTEVTFIDPVGEATLSFFGRLGAKFIAEDVFTADVCKRLSLPLARNGKEKV